MTTPEARSCPRVAYHAAVELSAPPDEGESPRTLAAEALDLGEGGMRVSVSERVPIGAALSCHLTLDGRATTLTGRVAWLRAHTSPTPHGMGIRFDELPHYEQRLLAEVVARSSAGYRPVQLHFDGVDAPIVARARVHAGGLTLSAPLPILERGAGVEVRIDEDGAALRGRVDEVRVVETDSRRRLEVELVLGDPDGARFRREARYASSGTLGVPRLDDADRVAATAAPTTTASRGRTRAAAGLVAALAVGAVAGAALAIQVLGAGALPIAVSAASGSRAEASTPATPVAAGPASNTTQTSPLPEPTPAAPALPLRRAATTASTTPVAAPASTTPSLSVEGLTTILYLPFSGSLAGMVARTWAEPAALALDLPDGRVELGSGAHALRGGSVAGLRVSQRGDAGLLRVRLAAPIARYAVSAHEGLLELRLFASE